MARGLGIGFISTPELTVPQVGSSSERVSQQPFAVLPDGRVRKGAQKSQGTKWKGGVRSSGPWRLSLRSPLLLARSEAVMLQEHRGAKDRFL